MCRGRISPSVSWRHASGGACARSRAVVIARAGSVFGLALGGLIGIYQRELTVALWVVLIASGLVAMWAWLWMPREHRPDGGKSDAVPVVVPEYELRDVWHARRDSDLFRKPITLHNTGDRDAIEVAIPEMQIDALTRIEFRQSPIPRIAAKASIELVPDVVQRTADGGWLLEPAPFWKALAGDVIGQKFDGKKPRSWPLYITYRDQGGARYFTRGEFRSDGIPVRLYFVFLSSGLLSEAVTP
jgi:hypothetical protein